MKKLGMLGIIAGAAILTAAPLSLQWSQGNMALSLDRAEAREGRPPAHAKAYRRAVYGTAGLGGYGYSSPADCGYIPYGTSYAAPCGIYSSSYAIAYERLQAAAPSF